MPRARTELRTCDDCGRTGRDGGCSRHSFCNGCQQTVDTPADDKCPDCGEEGRMVIACRNCGGRYALAE